MMVITKSPVVSQVTFELCEDLSADGVVYGEIRYCPSLHCNAGLSVDEVVRAVARGLHRFHGYGLNPCFGNLGEPDRGAFYQIITALRDLGPRHAVEMAELAAAHKGVKGRVVGFDLAGNEVTKAELAHEAPP